MRNKIIMKCLVVDDEAIAIEGIKSYINKIEWLEVIDFSYSAIEASTILKEKEIDLLFLDINMPHLTGLDFLESLKNPPLTILTTAYSEYALEGYRLNVVDYLLKPISFQRFFQAVEKAEQIYHSKIEKPEGGAHLEDLFIKQGDTLVRIYVKDILYIESMQNYIRINVSDKTHIVHQTMTAIEAILPGTIFFRIHKSYLVNLAHLSAITGNAVIINEKKLPLSKYRREDLLKYLVNHKLINK